MVAREQQEIKSEVWSLSIFWTDPSRLAKELLRRLQSEKKKFCCFRCVGGGLSFSQWHERLGWDFSSLF